MSGWDDAVRQIADMAGIRLGYRDGLGHDVETPLEAVRELLAAIRLPADNEAAARDSVSRLEAKRDRLAPQWIIAKADEAPFVSLNDPNADLVGWSVVDEAGVVTEGHAHVGHRDGPGIHLPPLAAGYYKATLTAGARPAELTILSAPESCWRPTAGKKRWGVYGPAYGLVSAVDLGIGDFGDIGAIGEASARRGASFLGLSPLHTLFPAERHRISPYSPSSRLFRDPIYVDPRKVPGLGDRARALLAEAADDGRLAKARGGPLVDYAAVWAVKAPMLEALWHEFRHHGGSLLFDAFRSERGMALNRHAAFEAFAAARSAAGESEPYAGMPAPDSAALTEFAAANREAVEYHSWLQWLADDQLSLAANAARSAGMEIGLLADLAVGVDPQGSEAWAAPDGYLGSLSVGAPPDELAPHGQNWGLRGLDPFALEANGMAAFRALISANMRHVGALRIDHAFQLRRLYLIPDGLPSSAGAYLRFPTEAMLAVLRIESHRARCMVIGEDLGTHPPGFSETIRSSGILGYRVLYFEREQGGDFRPPAAYDEVAMAVIDTHDLATLEGWWRGEDIEDRLKYGITDIEGVGQARRERDIDRHRLMALLRNEGLVDSEELPATAPLEAVARLLGRCRSELVGLQLDDLAGAVDPQNIPGVVEDAPNWRRRLPMTIAELATRGGPLDRFAQAMAAEGRNDGLVIPPRNN